MFHSTLSRNTPRYRTTNIIPTAHRLRDDWKRDLGALIASTRSRLTISSPYITERGTDFVLSHLSAAAHSRIQVSVLTDLSPLNVAQASTDPGAIHTLASVLPQTRIVHLPRIHAKVYVADAQEAIVTSGNLTAGGLDANYEYGTRITDPKSAAAIEQDITDYAALGAPVPLPDLASYSAAAAQLRGLYAEQIRAVRRYDTRLRRAMLAAADHLTRLRLAGGPIHTVFAVTILYLLAKHGPLTTAELHPRIEAMHPDLCDNSIDRVIDGHRFGKKWKHAVRTAQQQLKKRGQIALQSARWTIPESP